MSTVENAGQGSAESLTSFAFDFGFVPTENRLLVAEVTHRDFGGTPTVNVPAGWTQIFSQTQDQTTVTLAYRIAGAAEPQIHTWTGAQGKWAGGVIEVSGQDGNPIDAAQFALGTSATPTSPAITTTAANCLVLSGFGQRNASSRTLNASLTSRWNIASSASSQVGTAGGTLIQALAGDTGAIAHSSSSVPWVAYNLSIKPVPAAQGPSYDAPQLEYKVGADVGTLDMSTWFTGTGAISVVVNSGLPTGLSVNGNDLTDTLDASGVQTMNVTATDAGTTGSTIADVVFDVRAWEIQFLGSLRLEDDNGNPITTSNVEVSLIEGNMADDLTAVTPIHIGTQSISDGTLVITLPDTEVTSKQYEVLLDDTDETNQPLGLYVRGST